MNHDYDALVVGAGVTGLAAARLLAQAGLRVGVVEASPGAGGALHTARFNVDGNPFWLELGAHTLFNSYRTLLTLFPELRLGEILLRRRNLPYRLWRTGALRSIPAELHWGELARHLPHALWRRREGARVADWFSAVAGARNYAAVIGPSLDALLCQPAAEFPADLIFKSRDRASGFPRSFSLQGGLGAMVERLAEGIDLHTSTPLRSLARDGTGFRCDSERESFSARALLLAVPADEAARLLAPLLPALAARLARIPVQPLDSTAVVVRAGAPAIAPVAGLVARDAPWYSMVSRDVIADPLLRGFTFHFRPQLSPGERIEALTRLLRIDAGQLLAVAHASHRLPALRLGHGALVEAIDRDLRDLPLGLAGNYFGGLSIEDCVARAHGECQRLLQQGTPLSSMPKVRPDHAEP